MSRRLHLRKFQWALVLGMGGGVAFAAAGLFVPASIAWLVALAGLAGIFIGKVGAALNEGRRFQFSLATLLWVMFLLPASYLILDGYNSADELWEYLLLMAASFVLKEMLTRIGARHHTAKQDIHPLDD